MRGDRLQQLVEVQPAILLLESGTLDESKLDEDAKAVRDFYRGRGWRDARVDWSVTRSPDDREAIVTFYVLEGVRYQLGDVRIEIAEGEKAVMDAAQIKSLLDLRLGSPGNKPASMPPSSRWNLGTTPWAIWMFASWIDPSVPAPEPTSICS